MYPTCPMEISPLPLNAKPATQSASSTVIAIARLDTTSTLMEIAFNAPRLIIIAYIAGKIILEMEFNAGWDLVLPTMIILLPMLAKLAIPGNKTPSLLLKFHALALLLLNIIRTDQTALPALPRFLQESLSLVA
jgi:hypothetical protein